jgi:hypothetical protein
MSRSTNFQNKAIPQFDSSIRKLGTRVVLDRHPAPANATEPSKWPILSRIVATPHIDFLTLRSPGVDHQS